MSKRQKLVVEAKALKKEVTVKEELPHLFRIKPYEWMQEYWSSTNRMKFICAGNQLGKSTAQIIHAIDLATNKNKWPEFFPRRNPQVFYYVYPSKGKTAEEFREKWIENLPKGSMKDHATYGWEKFNIDGEFGGIKFNSGVAIYFKSWGVDLQAGTADAVFCDEEIPFNIYPELAMRISANNGMFSMVFTATLNQPFWFDVMEKKGRRGEKFPEADKWQISMEHHCRYFADGTPSHFTPEEVNKRKNSIGDQTEVDRRIHGRFVTSSGRKFKTFSRERNVVEKSKLNGSFEYYAGVDIGTGGEGHPAAISIVAVRTDFKYARLIRFWKGNDQEDTTTTYILNKYVEMSEDLPMTKAYYDWHSKEFYLRAVAAGIPFDKAEKSHAIGDDLLNVLFKNKILEIEEGEMTDDLCAEFESLKATTAKKDASDDGIDSLRYAISSLPWDFSGITTALIDIEDRDKPKTGDEQRIANANRMLRPNEDGDWDFEKEIDFYNDLQSAAGDYYDDF